MSPFFEYLCQNPACAAPTEIMTSFKDRPDHITCENCGHSAKLAMSASSFDIKGYNAKNNYGATDKSRRK